MSIEKKPASSEDASDSDVSTYTPDPRYPGVDPGVYLTKPVEPPPANLETKEAIEARLTELASIEKENAYRYELLSSKRQRKDDKTRQRRAIEDHRIQTARANKDERVRFRRVPQDNAFAQVDRAIDAEEFALRHKLKRLKKGRPLDEPEVMGRTYSSASMSPPGPSNYQSPAPPAKRHQPGPPSHMAPQRPRPGSRGYGPPPPAQSQPQYPASNGPSSATSEKFPSSTPQQPHLPLQHPPSTQLPQRSGPAHTSPPHNADSNYNVLPPPSSSSFAPINAPTSGFAPINPPAVLPSSSTPVQANVKPMPGSMKGSQPSSQGLDNAFHHLPTNPPGRVATPSSTGGVPKYATHPYTRSEAYNNRHHKCERADGLNRGIWTSYGPEGTVDNPTGPKVEMYLRCSHGNCMRMAWRTVHGLQCHIVKDHNRPTGTIPSLQKALDEYGVPVSKVEEYEKLHGPGSGGTMAYPKNTKRGSSTKSKTMPLVTLGKARVLLPSASPMPPPAAPAPNNLLFPKLSQRTPTGGFLQNDIVYSDDDEEDKADGEGVEKADDSKMEDASNGVAENKPSVQAPMAKGGKHSLPTATEPNAQEKTEMTSPSIANKEAPGASVIGDSAETNEKVPLPAYNQAQRELQGNDEAGESDNDDCIVVMDKPPSPQRTLARRLAKIAPFHPNSSSLVPCQQYQGCLKMMS
jgi:hypothetical protein